MLSPELGEIYSIVGGAALAVALVGGYKFGRDTSSTTWRNFFLVSGGVFAAMLIADVAFGIVPPSPKTVETPKPAPAKVEKPAPPKVERPEESFYAESYDAIRHVTGQRITERWMLEFGERVTPEGTVETHGFVEFNDDGVKRQFWLIFDGKTRKCLRVKIDSELLYSEVGW